MNETDSNLSEIVFFSVTCFFNDSFSNLCTYIQYVDVRDRNKLLEYQTETLEIIRF